MLQHQKGEAAQRDSDPENKSHQISVKELRAIDERADDLQAILYRNLGGLRRHRAPAVRHHVKEVAHRRLPQTILVIRRGRRLVESASRHHAVAVAGGSMTDGTEDVVALLSAIERFFRDRKRKRVDIVGIQRRGARVRAGWRQLTRARSSQRHYRLAIAGISVTTLLAKIKLAVGAQIATWHGAFDRRARRHSIFE